MRDSRLTDLFNRQSGVCAYCKQPMTLELDKPLTATKDHIIPRSKGGGSSIYNLVAACHTCNQAKSNKPLCEFICR